MWEGSDGGFFVLSSSLGTPGSVSATGQAASLAPGEAVPDLDDEHGSKVSENSWRNSQAFVSIQSPSATSVQDTQALVSRPVADLEALVARRTRSGQSRWRTWA